MGPSLELSAGSKRVVGPGRHGLQGIRCLVTALGPRVVATCRRNILLCLLLLLILLVLLLLLLLGEYVGAIWIVRRKSRLLRLEWRLWLQEVVLKLAVWVLVECSWLILKSIGVPIGYSSDLVLKSSWLCVLVVQVTGRQRLLGVNGVAKPVDSALLLVSLVIPGGLGLGHRSIVKERLGIALFQLPLPQFLFFLAQLNRLGQILIFFPHHGLLFASFPLFLGFCLARLDSQAILYVFVIGRSTTLPSVGSARRLGPMALVLVQSIHP